MALCERYKVADVDFHIIEPADLWTVARVAEVGRPRPPRPLPRAPPGGLLVHRRPEALRRRRLRPGPVARVPAVAPEAARRGSSPPSTPEPPRLQRRGGGALPGAVPEHPRLPQPRVPEEHGRRSWPPTAATTTGSSSGARPTPAGSPMMMLPFWDVDESVAETSRPTTRAQGRPSRPATTRSGCPAWWTTTGSRCRPGPGDGPEPELPRRLQPAGGPQGAVDQSKKMDFTRESSLVLLGNAQNIAEVVLSGVCHRYPDLRFVSVENGAGGCRSWPRAWTGNG